MKALIFLSAFLLTPLPLFACNDISGKYKSVSESHWNYVIEIYPRGNFPSGVEINYFYYWFGRDEDGQSDEQYKTTNTYEGYCTKSGNDHYLKFDGRTEKIIFNKNMSLQVLGEEGTLPGIEVEFSDGKKTKLWKFDQ